LLRRALRRRFAPFSRLPALRRNCEPRLPVGGTVRSQRVLEAPPVLAARADFNVDFYWNALRIVRWKK
jgi:hypothetical protein